MTLRQLQVAQDLLRKVVLAGDGVLFVCTKRQLKQIVRTEAERCDAFFVTERWLGGMMTNFQTIKKGISRLNFLNDIENDGSIFPGDKIALAGAHQLQMALKNKAGGGVDPQPAASN